MPKSSLKEFGEYCRKEESKGKDEIVGALKLINIEGSGRKMNDFSLEKF